MGREGERKARERGGSGGSGVKHTDQSWYCCPPINISAC